MKKSQNLLFILLILTACTFVSCSALSGNHNTDGNFSISLSSQTARIFDINDEDFVTYTIKLKSTDGKSYSQTQSDTLTAGALRNAAFSFTDIPLKIELVISAQFETEEGVFFGGNSEPFTLTSSDTKQIAVELRKLLSTPYLLLSYPSNKGYYQIEQFDSLSNEPTFSSGGDYGYDQILSYCYDSDETLWFCNYNSDSYSYTLNYRPKGEATSQQCTGWGYSFADIDYDSSTDTLYLLHIKDNNNSSDSASFISLTNPADLEAGNAPEKNGLPAIDPSTKIQGGAAGEGSYYIYGYSEVETLDGPDKIVPWIAKAIPGTGSFTLGPKTELTDASLGLEPDGVYLDTFDTFEITDLTVQDGKVFALFKQIATDDYSLQLIQRGGLLVFEKKNDGTLVHKKTLGLAPMVRMTLNTEVWIDDDGPKPVYTDSNPSEETQLMQELPALLGLPYREDIDKYFCLPQKFVATKPKKLVFADNGAYIYIDEDGELQTSTKFVGGELKSDAPSRIIEVNLDDFSFSATELDPIRTFNTPHEGCGYQLIQREPEERVLEETLYNSSGSAFTEGEYWFSYVYPTQFKYHE